MGFYKSPIDPAISQIQETETLAKQILARGNITDVLFLGIGGSSLGPICLLSALQDRTPGRLKFHFMENPDPLDWKSTLKNLNPSSTLVVAVRITCPPPSWSRSTSETTS